jgi:hypothetical protein
VNIIIRILSLFKSFFVNVVLPMQFITIDNIIIKVN